MSAGLVPPEGGEGGSVPGLSPWLIVGYLLLGLHIVFPLCVSVCKSPLLIRTHQSYWTRAHLNSFVLLDYFHKDVISKQPHRLWYWGLGLKHFNFEGDTIQPLAVPLL